jgi:hypothetical protein
VIVLVATVGGAFAVDLDDETIVSVPEAPSAPPQPTLNLPRLVAAAAAGSTVVAVVDTKPPLVVSHDAGTTWRESGRGLPPGRAVALAPDDPDVVVYATRSISPGTAAGSGLRSPPSCPRSSPCPSRD